MSKVSTNIRIIREAKNWSQIELAAVAGVSQATVSNAETGEPGTRIVTYLTLAHALGVPLYQLFVTETDAAEIALLDAFRMIDPGRRKGWEDMARAVAVEHREGGE